MHRAANRTGRLLRDMPGCVFSIVFIFICTYKVCMQISDLSTTHPKQFVSNTFDDVTSRVKNSGFTLATGCKSCTNVTSDLHVRYINQHARYILHCRSPCLIKCRPKRPATVELAPKKNHFMCIATIIGLSSSFISFAQPNLSGSSS